MISVVFAELVHGVSLGVVFFTLLAFFVFGLLELSAMCIVLFLICLIIGSPCIYIFINIQWVFYYVLNIYIACQSLLIF